MPANLRAVRPRAAASACRSSSFIHNCIFLLNAGHETTTNLIGNSVDLLIAASRCTRRAGRTSRPHRHGDRGVSAHGKSQPARQPARSARHRARRRCHCRPAVTSIFASRPPIAIPAQFHDPDRLDIRRSPNRNLAFGLGIHACAGMSLARMEARIAIGKLVQRFRDDRACRRFRARWPRALSRLFAFSGRGAIAPKQPNARAGRVSVSRNAERKVQ